MIQLSVSWESLIRGKHLVDSTRSCPSQTCVSHLNFLKSSVQPSSWIEASFPLPNAGEQQAFAYLQPVQRKRGENGPS